MPTRFDRDTAVEALDPELGIHRGRIDPGWWVMQGPNGGYLAAILLRALAQRVEPARAARSLTVHYTARAEAGPVRIETRVEREGRSLSTVTGRMLQGERLLALALAAFSRPRAGPRFDHAEMPEVAPPEACPTFPSRVPIHDRFEHRWAIGDPPGSGSRQARVGGWIRSAEPQIADAPLVAAFTDAWPPACFSWMSEGVILGGVPTVDLTVHFRRQLPLAAARAGDFYLAVFHSRVGEEGFIEEDGEVWSRDGSLLVQSRQLAAIG